MSKVRILWLYDDLLDLYGDWANLLALTKGLDAMGAAWEIDHKSLGDPADLSEYQMVYIGPGKARNLEEAAKDFIGRKEEILAAVERDTVFALLTNDIWLPQEKRTLFARRKSIIEYIMELVDRL